MNTAFHHHLRLAALTMLFAIAPAAAAPPSLPAWDQLTGAQREQLIAPIRARWNAEPEQRAHMLERAERWQQLSPDQRARAHQGVRRWKHMSPAQRDEARALYARMRTLDEDGRRALKAKWRAMTAAERKAWVAANPAPKPRDDCDE